MFWLCWAVQLSSLVTVAIGTSTVESPQGKITEDRPVDGQEKLDGQAVPIHFVLLSTLNPPWARDQFRNAIQGHSLKDVKMPELHRMAEWKPGEADLQNAEHRRAWKSAIEQEPGTWTIVVEDARAFAKTLSKDGADFLKAGLSKHKNQPGSSGSMVDLNRDCKAPGKPFGYAVSPRSAAMLLVLGRTSDKPIRDIRAELVTQGRLSEACVSIASSAAMHVDEVPEEDFYDPGAEALAAGSEKEDKQQVAVPGKSQFLPVVDDRSSVQRGAARYSREESDIQPRKPSLSDLLGMLFEISGLGCYSLLIVLLSFLTCGLCAVLYVLPHESIRTKLLAKLSVSSKAEDAITGADLQRAPSSGSKPEKKINAKKSMKGCIALDANE